MESEGAQNSLLTNESPKPSVNLERRSNRKYAGWTKLLILAGATTTIGCSLPVGYNIGVVNAPAQVIKQFCNESIHAKYGISMSPGLLQFLWSSIVSIFLIGGAIGSLGGSYTADKIGRKGGLILSLILGACAGILFFTSKFLYSVEMLFIGRFLVGISAGLITTIMPMYLMELSPLRLKGSTGVLCPLGVCLGVLSGQIFSLYFVLGNAYYWSYCLALYTIPLIFASFFVIFLPESPKYLFVIKKENQRAVSELSRIRNTPIINLEEEIEELQMELQQNENKEKNAWTMRRVLKDKKLLLPLVLVCALQAGQQFSGINAVFYYSVSIFESTGLSNINSQLATIGAGCCNFFMSVLSIYLQGKFNRRLLIQISLSSAGFFLIVLTLSVTYMHAAYWMPFICIIGVLGFVLTYGIGLGPIPYFIGSELFEVGPRPSAMALGSMANWGGNFVIGLCFPFMQSYLGAISFFLFALVVLVLFVLVRVYLPETRGVNISKIAALCQNGFSSKPLSNLAHENNGNGDVL